MAEKEKEAGASSGQGLDDQELQVRDYWFSRESLNYCPNFNTTYATYSLAGTVNTGRASRGVGLHMKCVASIQKAVASS